MTAGGWSDQIESGRVLKHVAYLPLSVHLSSVSQLCPTFCDTMDCSKLDLPVHHQLPESTQTHVR